MGWDAEKKENFKIISNRVKWVPKNGVQQAHFSLGDSYNLYLDELFIMVDYLQAIGEMRLASNSQEPNDLL